MIVKIIVGDNKRYFSGDKIEVGIITEDKLNTISKDTDVLILEQDSKKLKADHKVKYTTFTTKEKDNSIIDIVATLGCKSYVMNDNGKTIDKYDAIHVEFDR